MLVEKTDKIADLEDSEKELSLEDLIAEHEGKEDKRSAILLVFITDDIHKNPWKLVKFRLKSTKWVAESTKIY